MEYIRTLYHCFVVYIHEATRINSTYTYRSSHFVMRFIISIV
jgi:hypothetical protein